MKVILKHYLDRLQYEEAFKPETERKPVPTITELANDISITRQQLHRIVGDDIKSLKLDVADDIIKAMRRRGFEMEVKDLLEFRE
ncbi:MAG: helix-turn-helix domain-containing protein [Anaerolineae bacterium]|nr:helix-turn-helix domain-containing protein [Anaerolineae bacterium]